MVAFVPRSSNDSSARLRISNTTGNTVRCVINDIRSFSASVVNASRRLEYTLRCISGIKSVEALEIMCLDDAACLGYVTAMGRLNEEGLCLLYQGTGDDPSVGQTRLLYLKASEPQRTCAFPVNAGAK